MNVNQDATFWGIHGGKTGDADTLFLQKKYIGLGWMEIDDLSKIEANREAFKYVYGQIYPNAKLGSIPVSAGQLFRFVHEMNVGDYVIYPSKSDKRIHIGQVESEYQYNPNINLEYPHQRRIDWIKSLPRTEFSQGALYEIGSAMSLFQVKNYSDEFVSALEGDISQRVNEIDNEIVALVAEDIEQTTRDFILKRLARELKGKPFEHFVAHLLEKMGYQTRVSSAGTDGGIDIIAHRDELGFEPPIIKVQVKSVQGSIGSPEVQALYGNIDSKGEYGLFVTLSTFSIHAKQFANGKYNLRLIDGDEFVNLVLHHYEDFDARYKGLIPLKSVYIPQGIEDSAS